MCAEQVGSTILIAASGATFALLACCWQLGAPDFPIVKLSAVVGQFVGFASCVVLFPLVSTYYGGWLISPVRAGTDLSSALATFVAMAQNPDPSASSLTFPTWALFLSYFCLSCFGLTAWITILWKGIGLRSEKELVIDEDDEEQEEFDECEDDSEEDAEEDEESLAQRCSQQCENLACPRALILPVCLATVTQVTQWCIAISFGYVGAVMTDPSGCNGSTGQWVYRWSLTLSQTLVPGCSLLSSLRRCPEGLYYVICLLQYAATVCVCLSTYGVGRTFWTSTGGQYAYITSYAVCGGLEGYVITMTYRYIGDAEGIPLKLRHSASSLLSFLTVISINLVGFYVGWIVSSGQVACVDS
eukprot:gnl/TRDRNA2_/TRDRNA2_170708_c1_seq3.p1 gnl/TRDRNA2_/TRDRNA2_170708_c1~~gnl/TRDRNA2_/TRDRNA2_170708_c1_seq3.p1  ORF type:complete len:416 (+),score=37.34 gnl/TRDRNA2_/TRDRNA2_170708_c1_seq3:175-1248(+)